MGMDGGVCTAGDESWARMAGGGRGQYVGQIGGGFSHESENDLAAMVSDFLENGSGGTDSRYSSDSDSGFCDFAHLANNISYYKLSVEQYEQDLLMVVNSLLLSVELGNLHLIKSGPCNASCIRFSLVKLLRRSGYDAAVCVSRWQGNGNVPGGDHEYIEVIDHTESGSSERLIIDIDFRSHFEIARAVDSYDRILKLLPVVYVGSLTKLKQYLQVMVEAARWSLKYNSMPLPPWRSLAYLQAKWQSRYQRQLTRGDDERKSGLVSEHKQCRGHLKRLQSLLLQSEVEVQRMLKPMDCDKKWRLKLERWRRSSIRTL